MCLVNKWGIYGLIISRFLVVLVVCYWGIYIDFIIGCGIWYVFGVIVCVRYISVIGWYLLMVIVVIKWLLWNLMCLMFVCCIWFSKFCILLLFCFRLVLLFVRFWFFSFRFVGSRFMINVFGMLLLVFICNYISIRLLLCNEFSDLFLLLVLRIWCLICSILFVGKGVDCG